MSRAVGEIFWELPSRAAAYNRFAEFNHRGETLKDGARPGHSYKAVNDENIFAVKNLVEENSHITYAETEANLKIELVAA